MQTFVVYLLLSLPLVGGYVLLGMGITVIYQASRVLNLAHGAMAMGGAYATYALYQAHIPLVLDVVLGLAFAAVLGLGVERVFVRRLRVAGPTTQTVGTVAVLSLAIAFATRIFGSLPVPAPDVFPRGALQLFSPPRAIPLDQLLIFPVGIAGAALLFVLFRYTDIGLAMRGAAQNRRGAALRGVDPDKTAALAWIIGGAFAGLAGILLAPPYGLDPFTISLGVLPAFVAALIGGLESMAGVCIGAAIIGLVQGMVPALIGVPIVGSLAASQGEPALVLGVLALIVMAMRGQRLSTGDVRAEAM